MSCNKTKCNHYSRTMFNNCTLYIDNGDCYLRTYSNELEKNNKELKEDLNRDNVTINIVNHANVLLSNKIKELEKQNEEFKKLILESKREHYYCDDSWYTCPAHEEGCADDSQGEECNCGVGEWNAKIEEILKEV